MKCRDCLTFGQQLWAEKNRIKGTESKVVLFLDNPKIYYKQLIEGRNRLKRIILKMDMKCVNPCRFVSLGLRKAIASDKKL